MAFSTYKQIALAAIRGNWGNVVVTCIIASLLGGGIISSSSSSSSAVSQAVLYENNTVSISVSLFALLAFVLGGAVAMGLARYMFALIYRQPVRLSILFDELSNDIGRGVMLTLLRTIFTFLWTLLFIVPGIIAGLSYSMAPYIMAENPQMSASEAIRLSKQVMNGHKMELFVLGLSFIGWSLLSALTCGIGFLFLAPYMEATYCAFYLNITGRIDDRNVVGFLS